MCLVASELVQNKKYNNPVEFFPLDKAFESCDRKLRYIKHCENHVDWLMISIICLFIEHKTINQKQKLSECFMDVTKIFLYDLKAPEKKLVEILWLMS